MKQAKIQAAGTGLGCIIVAALGCWYLDAAPDGPNETMHLLVAGFTFLAAMGAIVMPIAILGVAWEQQ